MKKIYFTAMAAICMTGAAYADFQPATTGGLIGGADSVVTVRQASEMRDDTFVVVQGNIVQQLDDDKYLFKDSTGSIRVEIDKKDWGGVTVTPNDTVKLYGEVDRGFMKTEIDVDRVELVKSAQN